MTAIFDVTGKFVGHEPNLGCLHRPLTQFRSWCQDCNEWCYPETPCKLCQRALDADVPEVEVTTDLEPVGVPVVQLRRSGAKNLSSPQLQAAFIDEARHAMGQPSERDVQRLVGRRVALTFNDDTPGVIGVLTRIVRHPTAIYLVLDDKPDQLVPLNAIQGVEEV